MKSRHHRIAAALLFTLVAGCSSTPGPIPENVLEEVSAMADEDQRWEHLVMDRAPESQEPGFFDRKNELQDRHAERCREIFLAHGLPSPERVGEDVASDFWVLVQHSDRHPEFQAEVLAAMRALPDSGVDPSEMAYLVDRVAVNTGKGQIYGTQVDYDLETGRAYPKPLASVDGVDQRRAEAGLEPLWRYINGVCELHFRMNQKMYEEKGRVGAWVYPEGFSGWPESRS